MKILLVDHQALLREPLRDALREIQRRATIFEAPAGNEALQIFHEHPRLDLILLDIGLPDHDGFELLAEFRESDPGVSIVAISALQDSASIVKAINLGAAGFIPKSASPKVLLEALRVVFAGGTYIPPQPLAGAMQIPMQGKSATTGIPVSGGTAHLGLTKRQIHVLSLLARRKSNKAISRILDLTESTVEKHVRAILKTLNVKNRTEAAPAASAKQWDIRRTLKQ